MTDILFDIEPVTPRWKELAELHGISCNYMEPHHLPPIWLAEIEWFGNTETDQAETEREAVIALIHQLQLEGWKTVSL